MKPSTLPEHHPHLVPSEQALKDCRARLEDVYADYTENVSPDNMAMSLESASYILWTCEQLTPASAVDFGSGFTSYVLRSAVENVWSVDDDAAWLARTGQFLEHNNLSVSSLVLIDDYKKTFGNLKHDVVVYDFSRGEMRDNNFQFAIDQIASGGVGIMDDAHHTEHSRSMHRACALRRYDLFGLQDWTEDSYGRFAGIVVVP